MASIEVVKLQADLPFGARVRGLTRENVQDEAVRRQLNEVFERDGMIVFEGVEPTPEMQVLISNVFGPLKDHPVKSVERLDQKTMPGVITIRAQPDSGVVEIDGKQLVTWQPWHFDHSYNNELNRAGVLRAEKIASDGGRTAFADGIQIYRDMDPKIRAKIEDKCLIYTLDLRAGHQLFGDPKTLKVIREKGEALWEASKNNPRAIHPAVWTRKSGEKVLHMSPYGVKGLEGMETPEAVAILEEVWAEVERVLKPYYHEWQPTDMLIWDNWRMLHAATGCDPKCERIVHRTTIKGDYGLGRWDRDPQKAPATADAMM
jgi:taurine dioxygenase